MGKEIVVRGILAGPRRIELDEPVTGVVGAVEVTVRPAGNGATGRDVFALIAALAPGRRTKAEIDRDLVAERASWAGR